MRVIRTPWSLGAAIALLPSPLPAQVTPEQLKAAVETSPAIFSAVASVRELTDGRLLVSDPVDNQLFVISFRSGERVPVGRAGAGPREYGSSGALWTLMGDSTLFPDPVNRRVHVLASDRFAVTRPPDHPFVEATGANPTAVDRNGGAIIVRRAALVTLSSGLVAESLVVVRIDRTGSHRDTVTTLRSRPIATLASGSGAVRNPLLARAFGVPLTGSDQALLFPDGWVAVARQSPYRVEWHTPAGERREGAPLPDVPFHVDAAEQDAYLRRAAEITGRRPPERSAMRWPEVIAPFIDHALIAAPDGSLLIARQPTARHPEARYDVIDRQGNLRRRLDLGLSARIVGVGAHAIYVATVNDAGLWRLGRHVWP